MHKRTETYVNFNDQTVTEDFYFDFDETEILEMELSAEGSMTERLQKIMAAEDTRELLLIFKGIVLDAYGEKSPDGRRFVKNEDIRAGFRQTKVFSRIYMTLATDADQAAKFINEVTPDDMVLPKALANAQAAEAAKHPSLQGYQKKEAKPMQEASLPHVGSDDIEEGDHVAIAPEEFVFVKALEDYTPAEIISFSPAQHAAFMAHFRSQP